MSPDQEPDPWPTMHDSAVALSAFLKTLSASERHVFHDGERSMLRAASGWIARSIGRPDLAPEAGDGG